MFSTTDTEQINSKGLNIKKVNYQINCFKKGFPFAKLIAPAKINNGIRQFNDKEFLFYKEKYDNRDSNLNITKFVPASGAASRMFKHLFEFRDALENNEIEELKNNNNFDDAFLFIDNIKNFAFYDDLKERIKAEDKYSNKQEYFKDCLDQLLNDNGLSYSSLPKALLKFHKYENNNRLAIEEHIMEAIEYANSDNNGINIHFTVSKEHLKSFESIIESLKPKYEKEYNTKLNIDFSLQKESTDTIAVDYNNNPIRTEDEKLIFRPGGHGALIENLNDIDSDLVFIKNIDNIVPDNKRTISNDYKKALAAYALEIQEQIFNLLKDLDEEKNILNIISFISKKLQYNIEEECNNIVIENAEDAHYMIVDLLREKLNRPIRVCGMVPNIGEPGGGPFWVEKDFGKSLQIVESAEINTNDNNQKALMAESTHFNPVDLICLYKDYKGNKFDLRKYIDPNSYFISNKTLNGKKLKALELPGLWNGAMAKWTTLFVEVPLETFNPVKTVNDLLRPMHS